MGVEAMLFALIRSIICGEVISEEVKNACTPENLEAVYALASKHDLAHLVGQAVSKLDLPESEILTKCKQAAMQAVYRYVRLNHAYQQICQTLEDAKIPFIPLKGSVLREYYPEAWMRTSCDIDILVRPADLDRATQALITALGYTAGEKNGHDVSLFAPEGVHLELHYNLIEDERLPYSHKVLARYWDTATPCPQKQYWLRVSDEMFYFYHLAHMAKHVEIGGCGIRTFLDLWVLDHCVDHAPEKREKLLNEGALIKFGKAAAQLSERWFSGAEDDALSVQFEGFILGGGTYGTLKNRVAMQQRKRNGRFRYALSRIFLPYHVIRHHYPVLETHKWLTPVFQVVRWFKLLFKGGVKRSVRELRINASISQDEQQNAENLLTYLGLE